VTPTLADPSPSLAARGERLCARVFDADLRDNPPCGAMRPFGVNQASFAVEGI
jgi:hypothetical protein